MGRREKRARPRGRSEVRPRGQETVRRLCAEIRVLAPALLNRDGRFRFAAAEGAVHGLVCRGPDGPRYLIAVNPSARAVRAELSHPALSPVARAEAAFGEGELRRTNGKLVLRLEPFDVRVYRW